MIRRWRIPPGDLGPRGQARASANVYGDVLVLAATAGVSHATIRSGQAMTIVAATVVSTYLAHVLADVAAAALVGASLRVTVRHELRDSLPVISAGLPSVVLFVAASFGWPSPGVAQDTGCAVLLVRVAAIGLVYRRFNPSVTAGRAVALGLSGAAVAALAATLKLAFSH